MLTRKPLEGRPLFSNAPLDTYKAILELHPNQKAIIASGYSETDRAREAQRLGAGPYIKKPYTIEKIGLAVREILKG